MTLRIGEKLEAVRQRIKAGNTTLANDIAVDGIKAIFKGIGTFNQNGVVTEVTPEWKKLMSRFTDDPTELARLCGQDGDFNASDYGRACLAYIAGDSPCTSHTAETTGTRRSMLLQTDRDMLGNLDAENEDLDDFRGNDSTFKDV